jgi:tRNA uridine 5-carbamoylmethylation protein Kti12
MRLEASVDHVFSSTLREDSHGNEGISVQLESEPPLPPPFVIVLLLCGLPGAGKSTLARVLADRWYQYQREMTGIPPHQSRDEVVCTIEYDSIQEQILLEKCARPNSLSGPDDKLSEGAGNDVKFINEFSEDELRSWRATRRIALSKLEHTLKKFLLRGDLCAQAQKLVLVDDNFYLRSMRKQVYQTCQRCLQACQDQTKHDDGCLSGAFTVTALPSEPTSASPSVRRDVTTRMAFASLHVDVPLSVCQARNRTRLRPVPSAVLERMDQLFERPFTTSLGDTSDFALAEKTNSAAVSGAPRFEQCTCRVSSSDDEAWQFLTRVAGGQEHAAALQINTTMDTTTTVVPVSLRHQFDQTLRKAVGRAVQFHRGVALAANQAHKQALAGRNESYHDLQSSYRFFVDQVLEWNGWNSAAERDRVEEELNDLFAIDAASIH